MQLLPWETWGRADQELGLPERWCCRDSLPCTPAWQTWRASGSSDTASRTSPCQTSGGYRYSLCWETEYLLTKAATHGVVLLSADQLFLSRYLQLTLAGFWHTARLCTTLEGSFSPWSALPGSSAPCSVWRSPPPWPDVAFQSHISCRRSSLLCPWSAPGRSGSLWSPPEPGGQHTSVWEFEPQTKYVAIKHIFLRSIPTCSYL